MSYAVHYTNPATVAQIDTATIQTAEHTLDFAAYAIVDNNVIAALLNRAAAGVAIRLYLDRTELESEARGDAMLSHSPLHALLNVPNITIRVKNSSVLMHLKSYCVDSRTLRDGSANFSTAGLSMQDNSLTLTDDPTSLLLFEAKFEQMWNRPDNLTVAQAVNGTPRFSRTPSHQGGVNLTADSSTDTLT